MDEAQARQSPVFSVDGRVVYRWDDVVAFARGRGEWSALEEEARAGLSALATLTGEAADLDVDAAARAFRRQRGLLSADDLSSWLERRGVSVEGWLAYLRRALARGLTTGDAEVAAADVEACLWAEAMCSGVLDDLAASLAQLAAVAPDAPLEELEEAFEAFCGRAATEEAIDREIGASRMDWLRVRYAAAVFADRSAAAEAALCVREDRTPLAEVARTAGVAVEEREDWLEEAEPGLAPLLVGARPAELVGPVVLEEGVLLAEVREKTPVTAKEEAVRSRAAAVIAERAAARELTDRVVWHESV